jgi:putative PEP-CTERM system TPR-repeat lipoprotein
MPINTRKKQISIPIAAALLLLGGLAGCGKNETAASLVADAKQFQAKGDNKAAVIQLKNAIVKSPEDIPARITLGDVYLAAGDGASAEKEFRKAISLGAEAQTLLPKLLSALLAQRQFQKVIDETKDGLDKAGADVLAARGDAFIFMGKREEARPMYEQALKINPDHPSGLMGLARLAVGQRDVEGGNVLAQKAIDKNPGNVEVLMFQSALLTAVGKNDQALAVLDKVLALQPQHRSAHIEKAHIRITQKDFVAARAELDAARKTTPGNLQLTYVQALVDFSEEKNVPALEGLQQVLKVMPDHLPSVLLAGAVQFKLGSLPQAETHLHKYVEAFPNNLYARKLLVSTYLRLGRTADAVATLEPALSYAGEDSGFLALAGEVAMQGRDFKKAGDYFDKASKLSPKTAALKTSLALSRLGQGDNEHAIADLEESTRLDSSSTKAGTMLVLAEMRMKRYDKALAAVKTMEAAHPKDAAVQNLKGGIYLGKTDLVNAKAAFTQAMALDPVFFPAISNLAQIAIQEKKPEVAKKLYADLLAKDKKHTGALTALAGIAAVEGKVAETTSYLETAVAENPTAVQVVIQLARHYLFINEKPKAVTLLRKTVVALPNDPDVLDMLVQAQIATADYDGALENASKVAAMAPKSALSHFRLASAQLYKQNAAGAMDSLSKAIVLQPDYLDAQVLLAELSVRNKNSARALEIARNIQKQRPNTVVGYMLEGELLQAEGKRPQALAAFDKAQAIKNGPGLIVKQHILLSGMGNTKEADARLAAWRKANPDDPVTKLYQAELFIASKQFKSAIGLLEELVKLNPKNAAALNNLAWSYQQEGDPRALATAELAVKAAPKNAALLDTLGWILVEKGDTKRGVSLLQEAATLAPGASEIRHHLGAALVKAGDKAGARRELEKLLAENKDYPKIPDVRALLKQL